ncbi:unnamed protein product [Linum tenue]|uniref:DUF7812 domain-containing protein n=1 Tax=Linum tenue TaxID=586396 RepID=A0AAV0R3M5_9ROSI|nr:unnamed protein product [Linum tenue]
MPTTTDFRDIVANTIGFLSGGFSSAEKVVKPTNLKWLYEFLVHLSSNHQITCSDFAATSNLSGVVAEIAGVKLKSRDIVDLSDVLYKELSWRFEEFFSALSDHDSGLEAFTLRIEMVASLLRCCMTMLPFMVNDLALVEKGRVLLFILRRLMSLDGTYANGDCTSSIAPSLGPSTFACAMLEVFADELLVHRQLFKFLMAIDSRSSRNEMLFKGYAANCDTGTLLEVICAHFILSGFPGLGSDEHLGKMLFWCHENHEVRTPGICLQAALSLLINPVIGSAPKVFQAYLILLTAETIGIGKPDENERVELAPVVSSYFSAFERSIDLYARFVPSLCVDRHHFCASGGHHDALSKSSSHQLTAFDSFLKAGTRDTLHNLIAKLNSDWLTSVRNASLKSNIVVSSVDYVKESLYVFEECHRNKILSILACIVDECFSDANEESSPFPSEGETSHEDMLFLSSILKLMTSSMLQTVWFLQRCPSAPNAYRNSIVKSASHFEELSINVPVGKLLHYKMMATDDVVVKHKESKSMLLHFSGLLSFSYSTRLDFLAKDCLLMIMASLSLFLVQEGSLDALQPAVDSRLQPPFSECPPAEKPPVVSSNSKKIAARMRQIRDKDSRTCNGEAYFMLAGAKPSEYEDLADYVECEHGKDYGSWFRVRRRYRKWRSKKVRSRKLKRRNLMLRLLEGK